MEKTCKTVSYKLSLSGDEYAQVDIEWQEQLEIREELKDKPDELERYEEKLKQATFYYNRAEGYSSKGKNSTAKTFYSKRRKNVLFILLTNL